MCRAFVTVQANGLMPAEILAPAIAVLVILASTAVLALIAVTRRRRVAGASVALKELERVNLEYRPLAMPYSPLRHSYHHAVTSKAKFDRFDPNGFLRIALLESEAWFDQEIALRMTAVEQFGRYHQIVEAAGKSLLGTSAHSRVKAARFAAIEQKLFRTRRLRYPTPVAKVTLTVTYRSPQGQNSYTRKSAWDFDRLRLALNEAREVRARLSTAEAMRRRERSLMTPSLRMQILRRDGYRCRMCGAAAADGATLHIDHITPVSHNGRTTPDNLQTLCETCNIGKGNRFVG